MRLRLVRDEFDPRWTLGQLLLDGRRFGDVVEDVDRGLEQSMPLAELRARKVKRETAIPIGVYEIGVRWSPKHEKDVIVLHGVPAYGADMIEVHAGNTASDTDGCLCVGLHRGAAGSGTVVNSAAAIAWLERHVLPVARLGGSTISVERDPGMWAAFLR